MDELFFRLGKYVHRNSAKLIFCSTLALITISVAIKSATIDDDVNSWVQVTPTIDAERRYIEKMAAPNIGSTNQLLIQTNSNPQASILNVESFKTHIKAMAIATQTTIDLFDNTWSLKDVCYLPSLPSFDDLNVNILLNNMMPCAIKTPLDCFWEGSKIAAINPGVGMFPFKSRIDWKTLSPISYVQQKWNDNPHISFPFASIINWMNRIGLNTGYQFKPCLNPNDPDCPVTAPNKHSKEIPDIGAQLAGGCYGIASNEMHWLEDEIVGGTTRNSTGHIIHARALQSTIQLMGVQDMYDLHKYQFKGRPNENWSLEKSKMVLDAWQSKFQEELDRHTNESTDARPFNLYTLTSSFVPDSLVVLSYSNLTTAQCCFLFMTLFTLLAFPCFKNQLDDKATIHCDKLQKSNRNLMEQFHSMILAAICSLYIGINLIASIGLGTLFNLPINAATIQLLPPIALYYSFNQLFTLANSFKSRSQESSKYDKLCSHSLVDVGSIFLLELLTYSVCLLIITILPISATRVFAFQVILHLILSTLTSTVIFPSIITIFLRNKYSRRKIYASHSTAQIKSNNNVKHQSKSDEIMSQSDDQFFSQIENDLRHLRIDVPSTHNIDISAKLQSNGFSTTLMLSSSRNDNPTNVLKGYELGSHEFTSADHYGLPPPEYSQIIEPPVIPPTNQSFNKSSSCITDCDKKDYMSDNSKNESPNKNKFLIINGFSRMAILFSILIFFVFMSSNIPRINFGLDIKDIVDRDTYQYGALDAQKSHFYIFNIFAITKAPFDYPKNQRLLYEYYEKIAMIDGILINKDDKPRFWLESFRRWLLELQRQFDSDKNQSLVSNYGWKPEASENTKLAYKLLAQTGKLDNPIDKSQVETTRLVDTSGIINQEAFYNYLTAWISNDPFSYSLSEACFVPEPKNWFEDRDRDPEDLRLEKAKPLVYAQIPFSLKIDGNNYDSIAKIRTISSTFKQLNLPNFPTGLPFIFWDQFLHLGTSTVLMIVGSSISTLLVIAISTGNMKMAIFISSIALLQISSLHGFLGFYTIQFNNIIGSLLMVLHGLFSSFLIHAFMVSLLTQIAILFQLKRNYF